MTVFLKAWQYYREYGLREFARRVHRLRTFIVYAKELTNEPEPPPAYPDVLFRVATTDEDGVREWFGRAGQEIKGGIAEVLVDDARAFVVVGMPPGEDDTIIYLSHVSRRDNLFLLLPEAMVTANDACSRRIWVPDHARRRGLALRGVRFAEFAAHHQGVGRLWAFVLPTNRASVKLHEAMGYEQVGRLRIGRFLGRRVAAFCQHGSRKWRELQDGCN